MNTADSKWKSISIQMSLSPRKIIAKPSTKKNIFSINPNKRLKRNESNTTLCHHVAVSDCNANVSANINNNSNQISYFTFFSESARLLSPSRILNSLLPPLLTRSLAIVTSISKHFNLGGHIWYNKLISKLINPSISPPFTLHYWWW